MSEYGCDNCGTEVPNGSGRYPYKDGDDRVCDECYRKLVDCSHPIGTWEHHYDQDSALGDYYTCGLCGELTQVG